MKRTMVSILVALQLSACSTLNAGVYTGAGRADEIPPAHEAGSSGPDPGQVFLAALGVAIFIALPILALRRPSRAPAAPNNTCWFCS